MARYLLVPFAVHVALAAAAEPALSDVPAPGRADRMFKRAGKDLGTFQVDCKGSEGACNNACFYTRCLHPNDPNANRITYIGPGGNNKEDERNRIASGCNFNTPSSGSVCTNFPFSQKFSDPSATTWQCDEWPPAMSQQMSFVPIPAIRPPNSLRCMPGAENGSLGGKLGAYVTGKKGVRDDFFHVDFTTKIASADQSKVNFCLGIGTTNCGQDGFQFGLISKPTQNGKIDAPYNLKGNDNKYKLLNVQYKEIYQCSVEFTREGDNDFKNVKLGTFDNKDKTVADFTLSKNGDSSNLKGLPNDLQVKRTGALNSKIEFTYAPGMSGSNVNYFAWNSESSGNGRGPWTDPATDPNRKPLRFCKVVPGSKPNTQQVECWFPCYEHADGK